MLTDESRRMIEFMLSSVCMVDEVLTRETKIILRLLHSYISEASVKAKLILSKKLTWSRLEYNITSKTPIPRPNSFPISSFPKGVFSHIGKKATHVVQYIFDLFGHSATITFTMEGDNKTSECDGHIFYILVWLIIAYTNSSASCAESISIYFYMTSLKKILPTDENEIIDQMHVNTGFTYCCPAVSEIVIYRKEEWFKVLIHESWHTFGLDFAEMELELYHNHIRSIIKVKSDVNLFECYTEFWAEIMNGSICSFFLVKDKLQVESFYKYFSAFVNLERAHKYFQLVKMLNHMGTTYETIINGTMHNYREATNVLSYYILTAILMHDYQTFLKWCKINNSPNLLQFAKTQKSLNSFCTFINGTYSKKSFLRLVRCAETLLKETLRNGSKTMKFICENARMSIVEAS